ncbi:melanopsin-A-like [Montipora capricornis]|uniref:melanopsin-A-like n=1 Tax=Montipora capricornis TaxID=246305 RepID=UPI0035F1CDFE
MDPVNSWKVFFVVIFFTLCILGTLSNSLVVYIIHKNARRLPACSYFILSIAFSDLLSCSVPVPLSIAAHYQQSWPFGMAGCRTHAFMIFCLGLVSITHLTIIAVEKYLTIARSVSKQSYFTKRQILLLILACWIYSLAFSVAPLLGWSKYGMEGTNDTCSIQWNSALPRDHAYFALMFFACFFLPIASIAFCYYKIHKASKRVVKRVMNITFCETINIALLRRHRRGAMYFSSIIAAYIISWSPYAAVSILAIFRVKVYPLVSSACGVLAKTSFLLNPIMYVAFSSNFRRLMMQAFTDSSQKQLTLNY